LGDKDLQELEKTEEDKKNLEVESFIETRREHAKSANTHSSNDDHSQDMTYDSIQEPSTPTLKIDQLGAGYSKSQSVHMNYQPKKVVVVEGHIKKITAWIIYKRRYMELSYTDDVPRLVYYTANKKQLRNEIPLTKSTKVYLTGPSKFEISDMDHTYYFRDCGGEAKVKQWVNALTDAISNINYRKMSFKGNKAMSATFA
jgi:hypothetical protein